MCHFGLQSTHVASRVGKKKDEEKYVTTQLVSTWDILTRRDRFFSVEQIWQQKEKRGRKSDTSWNNNCILKKVWQICFFKKVWFSFHVEKIWNFNNYREIVTWLVQWILYLCTDLHWFDEIFFRIEKLENQTFKVTVWGKPKQSCR